MLLCWKFVCTKCLFVFSVSLFDAGLTRGGRNRLLWGPALVREPFGKTFEKVSKQDHGPVPEAPIDATPHPCLYAIQLLTSICLISYV